MADFLRLLSDNWRLKLAALGLAMFLWTAVRVPTGPSRGVLRDVPVRVQLNDPGWVLDAEPVPTSVQVRVQGASSDLVSLQLGRPVIRVPVDAVGSNDTIVQLRRDWLSLRDYPGVVVDDVQPSSVRLRFEPVQSVAVPLARRVTGSLHDTLALTQPLAHSPQVARVSGPASRIAQIDSIPMVPFDLSSIERSDVYSVPLDTTGLGDLGVRPGAASLTVQVEGRMERIVTGVPVIVERSDTTGAPAAPEYEILPSTFQLTLSGARTRVVDVSIEDLRIIIQTEAVQGLAQGEERRVPIRLDGLPDMVEATAPDDSVTVRRPEEG